MVKKPVNQYGGFWGLVIVYILSLLHIFWMHNQLPQEVATRFGWSGRAVNSSPKETHFWLQIVTQSVFFFMFLGFSRWMLNLSDKHVNIPNKDYWLAPERRLKTLKFLSTRMEYLGMSCLIFMMYTFNMIYQANLKSPVEMNPSYPYGVMVYILVIITWTFFFIRYFKKKSNPL